MTKFKGIKNIHVSLRALITRIRAAPKKTIKVKKRGLSSENRWLSANVRSGSTNRRHIAGGRRISFCFLVSFDRKRKFDRNQ